MCHCFMFLFCFCFDFHMCHCSMFHQNFTPSGSSWTHQASLHPPGPSSSTHALCHVPLFHVYYYYYHYYYSIYIFVMCHCSMFLLLKPLHHLAVHGRSMPPSAWSFLLNTDTDTALGLLSPSHTHTNLVVYYSPLFSTLDANSAHRAGHGHTLSASVFCSS